MLEKINPDSVICDWISVSQQHRSSVNKVTKEHSFTFDTESGEMLYETGKGIQHEGSYSTSIRIRSMNGRVELSGNVGRWGRPDNVFGYPVEYVKKKCNEILAQLDLPPFTDGDRVHIQGSKGNDAVTTFTGAKVSRLDLTKNFATGSLQNASDFKYWLSTQKLDRKEPSLKSNTLSFGPDSTYSTLKIYTKGTELINHARRHHGSGNDVNRDIAAYIQRLAYWADDIGLIRIEKVLKFHYLKENGFRHWRQIDNDSANQHYTKGISPMNTRCNQFLELEQLKPAERAMYHAYLRGENLRDYGWSTATYYRYRKSLLRVGVDIARPLNVRALKIQPRIIELTPASLPDFYRQAA